MKIVFCQSVQRTVYFETSELLNHWHVLILKAQGIYENRIDAYQPIGRLGQGSFGIVVLSKHAFSGVEVAVKII